MSVPYAYIVYYNARTRARNKRAVSNLGMASGMDGGADVGNLKGTPSWIAMEKR